MPSRLTECKEDGCTIPPLDHASYCAKHVGAKRRCKATRASSGKTQRCKKPALIGLDVCERHGGSFPQAARASEKAKALTRMQAFTRHYEGDLDPVNIFEQEFRRTLGRIQWLEEELSELHSPLDLIWGTTKEETVRASEFAGTNTTKETRIHAFEEMLRWERRHLLDMEKVWIGAKLDAARLDLMKSYVDAAYNATLLAVSRLGLDSKSADVRAVIAQAFMEQGEHRALESGA